MIDYLGVPLTAWRYVIRKCKNDEAFKVPSKQVVRDKTIKMSTCCATAELQRKVLLCNSFLSKFYRVTVVVEERKAPQVNISSLTEFTERTIVSNIDHFVCKDMSPVQQQTEKSVSFTATPLPQIEKKK